MGRTELALFVLASCAACGESARGTEHPHAALPRVQASAGNEAELAVLPSLARTGGTDESVAILEPSDGAELEPSVAQNLVVRVRGPARRAGRPPAELVLSLDGRRPRPVPSESLALAELLGAGEIPKPGAHDLVLAALGADGQVLDPAAGGVVSRRFFVGPKAGSVAPPLIACLAPFGTFYGKSPPLTLDFVVTSGELASAVVEIRGRGGLRRNRASGRGPFALGELESGDYQVTVSVPAGAAPAVPGRCEFTLNRELERTP
jgi:hypothetical protein